MFTQEDIVSRLRLNGFSEERILTVIKEVNDAIFSKIAQEYMDTLPIEIQKKIPTISSEEVGSYFEKNISTFLPNFSVEEFEKKCVGFWNSYFSTIEQR